jgi:hypothetical protein
VFGTFVNVFIVPKLEVGYGVVADLSDEGVVVCGTLTENFFGQTVDELVQRFYVKSNALKTYCPSRVTDSYEVLLTFVV